MSKLKKFLRIEADVEFFSCVHGVSMIFVYGFLLWLDQTDAIPYAVIVEMMLAGYFMSWLQKLLYFREGRYTKWRFRIRAVCWTLVPMVLLIAAQQVLLWFEGRPLWVVLWFDGIMLIYFAMVWVFLQAVYQEENDEWNRLLKRFKKEGNRNEHN